MHRAERRIAAHARTLAGRPEEERRSGQSDRWIPEWRDAHGSMLSAVLRVLGGSAMRQPALRTLYLVVLLSELGVSAVFPLRLLYAQAHHATPAQLGLMAGGFFLAPMLVQVPIGWLIDRWGRVPVLNLGVGAHALLGVAYLLFSTPVDLIVLRFLEGVAVAAVIPSVNAYIADTTETAGRAEAFGVLSATINAGLFVGPLVGGIVGQRAGFVPAYLMSAAFDAMAALLVFMRVREPARHAGVRAPERGSWREVLSLPLLGAYAAAFSGQIVFGTLSALWAIWVRDLGGSYTYIGLTFSVFALPQIALGAFSGRLADRWGRAPLLLGAGWAISAIYASYALVTNLGLILVLGVAEGIALVFLQPAQQSLLADASPSTARGRAQGLAGVAGGLGGSGAALLSLPLYHASRQAPFLLAAAVMACGSVVAAASAALLVRRGRP